MRLDRRQLLAASLAAAAVACQRTTTETAPARSASDLGIPGPYPGRVVAVAHPGSFVDGDYQAKPVQAMIDRGMMELTHAEAPAEAWRRFFEPGDVVCLKLNPVGRPAVISSPHVVRAIVTGLESAGVKRGDIIAYDRYEREFLEAGFDKWLPEGVRWTAASTRYGGYQLDMEGYDENLFMDMPLLNPAAFADFRRDDPHIRRSYVARALSEQANKVINLCLLKHHQSAGVTMALKNLSHGFVNNVNRSHLTTTANACGVFIPAVVNLPIFREKVVLNILDGVKAAYHGGPGRTVEHYAWAHRTMYFGTDPVALDKTGWKEIDKKRAEVGREPIALMKPDEHSQWLNGQVEHIELAGAYGLGEFDDEKIRVKKIDLS